MVVGAATRPDGEGSRAAIGDGSVQDANRVPAGVNEPQVWSSRAGHSPRPGLEEAPAASPGAMHFGRPPRIVMVNRFFPPDEAPTARLLGDLAAHLAASGFAPTAIASRPRVRAGEPPELARNSAIRRAWTSTLGLPGIAGRMAEYLTFALGATRHLRREVRSGDRVLVMTDPPLMSSIVSALAHRRGAQVVNWCQDLFPEIATAVGMPLVNGRVAGLLRALRSRGLRRAALNVAISNSMAARMRREGVPPERIAVVPNWADGDGIRPVEHRANRWREEHGLADRFVIGYSGNLGRVHDPRPIFALMQRMAGRAGTCFVIIGGGTGNAALQGMVGRAGLSDVRFLPYQPHDRLSESLSAIDLHLVSLRPACEGLSFPSKLYGILAAGRPVLFMGDTGGEVARVVEASGAGLAVDGRDPDALEQAVLELRADAVARGRAGRLFFERHFRKDLGLAAWLALLEMRDELVSIAGGDASAPLSPAEAQDLELADGGARSGDGRRAG